MLRLARRSPGSWTGPCSSTRGPAGKTRSLVDRVVAVVLHPDSAVPLRHVAAVTFTEKAGAELRDRLRAAFEAALTGADPGSDRASHAAGALEDLDAAAIGTLHSFAQRILGEHPVEAGLPPLIEVLDEVASSVAFDERWTALRAALLDDPGLEQALLLALAAGMRLEDLRSMARAFNDNWDLLESRVLTTPVAALPPVETAGLCAEALRLTEARGHCVDGDDKFLPRLDCLAGWAGRLQAATDDEARVAVLAEAPDLKWGHGRQASWLAYGLDQLKTECAALVTAASQIRASAVDAALRQLARRIAAATAQAAQARRAEGKLEFHDLLVLARDLLTDAGHGPAVRDALHQQYRRLLLDEFQDTDPIQIELAVRIAAGRPAARPTGPTCRYRQAACSWSGIRSSPSTGSAAPTSPPTCGPSSGSATRSSWRPTSGPPNRYSRGSTMSSAS